MVLGTLAAPLDIRRSNHFIHRVLEKLSRELTGVVQETV
jgi:hypothetical protein